MEAFIGAFSGVWLALFAIVFLACGAWTASIGNLMVSVLVVLAGFIGMDFLFGVSIWGYMLVNPLNFVGVLAVYFLAGAAYVGVWRWPDHIRQMKHYIDLSFQSWRRDRKKENTPAAFEEFLDSSHYTEYTPSRNKERITTWIAMWPFALAWELSHKPIRWITSAVYEALGKVFTQIGKNTARKNVKFD